MLKPSRYDGADGEPFAFSKSLWRQYYRPRDPEQTLLYRTLAGNLKTFLARQQQDGRHVPRFVEREMRAFLECGILAHGFLRVLGG